MPYDKIRNAAVILTCGDIPSLLQQLFFWLDKVVVLIYNGADDLVVDLARHAEAWREHLDVELRVVRKILALQSLRDFRVVAIDV